LTLANTYVALKSRGPQRKWHLAAVGLLIVERLATFSYFIPTMAGLMGAEGLSQGEIAAALSEWQLYNHGRHLLTLSGWLAALKALTLARPAGGDKRFFMNASRVELRRFGAAPSYLFLKFPQAVFLAEKSRSLGRAFRFCAVDRREGDVGEWKSQAQFRTRSDSHVCALHSHCGR